MNGLHWLAMLLGCVASFDDLRRRAVANWINLAGLAGGLACHTWMGGSWGLARSAGGAALGFTIFLAFYCAGAMGGGDVKLAAAFGALLGPYGILLAALLAAPVGAVMASACLLWKRQTRTIPYAPAISLGAWLALWGGG